MDDNERNTNMYFVVVVLVVTVQSSIDYSTAINPTLPIDYYSFC